MKRNSICGCVWSIVAAISFLSGCGAGARTFEQEAAEIYRPSTSYESFTRAEPRVKRLRPGFSSITVPQLLHVQFFKITQQYTGKEMRIARADAWISSMSGGNFGATWGLGRAYGIEANTIYGRHVLGYVYGNLTLVPKYEIRTRAPVQSTTGGPFATFGRDKTRYYFTTVTIDEVRPLPFQGSPEIAKDEIKIEEVAPEKIKEGLNAVYTKSSFDDAEARLRRMTAGTDWWDMVHQLGGVFLTNNFGGSYVLFMKGYANYERDQRWQLASETGVYEVWPFGYVENGKEIFKLSVIFLNGKLQQVVPYEPEATLAPRLRKQP